MRHVRVDDVHNIFSLSARGAGSVSFFDVNFLCPTGYPKTYFSLCPPSVGVGVVACYNNTNANKGRTDGWTKGVVQPMGNSQQLTTLLGLTI